MKRLKLAMPLIVTSILFCACPKEKEGHRYITFVNKSEKKIGYQLAFSTVLNIHQDTIFYCDNTSDNFLNNDSSFVMECPIRVDDWETGLNNSDYIQFLVMDGDYFNQYYSSPCDTIRKYVPILYCYRLKLEDLQCMNWTVVYPPEE